MLKEDSIYKKIYVAAFKTRYLNLETKWWRFKVKNRRLRSGHLEIKWGRENIKIYDCLGCFWTTLQNVRYVSWLKWHLITFCLTTAVILKQNYIYKQTRYGAAFKTRHFNLERKWWRSKVKNRPSWKKNSSLGSINIIIPFIENKKK